jgi:hypothetical protein
VLDLCLTLGRIGEPSAVESAPQIHAIGLFAAMGGPGLEPGTSCL